MVENHVDYELSGKVLEIKNRFRCRAPLEGMSSFCFYQWTGRGARNYGQDVDSSTFSKALMFIKCTDMGRY
jgi:hypothetical protein